MQLDAAVIAAPQLSAERFGPARQEVGDGAPMRGQHRRTMRLQVAASEATENVRHLGHASEAAHHRVEQLAQGRPRRFRQVGVDRRGGDILMAEEHLDDAGVHLLLEEPGRVGMSQRVRGCPATAGKVGRFDSLGEGADQDVGGDGAGPPTVGEEPPTVTMILRLPHPAQALVDRPWHGNEAFLVAFADDPQEAARLVDSGDGKSGGLADPQAAGIDQAEAAPVDRIADASENTPHLGMGKGVRQPLLLRQPDLFLKSAQSSPSVFR